MKLPIALGKHVGVRLNTQRINLNVSTHDELIVVVDLQAIDGHRTQRQVNVNPLAVFTL
jgi:hypothetical protein